jgi:hypothetical protein
MMQFEHTVTYTNIHDAFIWNGYKQSNIVPVNPVSAALQNANSVKDRIEIVEKKLLKMPPADIVTTHEFEPQKYIRTIISPPGCMIVGAEHKTPYKVILKKGTITVNKGDQVFTLTAPAEFDVVVGEKRVGYTHDEVIWADVYENPDNCTNIDILEERLYVIPEYGLYDWRKRNGQLQLGETKWLE